MESRRGDPKVGVGPEVDLPTPGGPDLAIDTSRRHVVRQHGHGRQHTSLDVLEVPSDGGRAKGPLVQIAHHHGARELLLARDGCEPPHVAAKLELKNPSAAAKRLFGREYRAPWKLA